MSTRRAAWRPKPAEVQARRIAKADTGRPLASWGLAGSTPRRPGGHDGLHDFSLYQACHCRCPGCWQRYGTGGRCICPECPCYVLR